MIHVQWFKLSSLWNKHEIVTDQIEGIGQYSLSHVSVRFSRRFSTVCKEKLE